MSISVATLDDLPELTELLGVLFAQESEFHPDAARQREGLRRIIADPAIGRILVWRDNGRARGMVNVLFTVSTALGARVAILEDMVVHPDYRNSGIGSLLVGEAIRCCAAEGCARITLLTDGSNESAQRFYARHEFRGSSMVVMRRSL